MPSKIRFIAASFNYIENALKKNKTFNECLLLLIFRGIILKGKKSNAYQEESIDRNKNCDERKIASIRVGCVAINN